MRFHDDSQKLLLDNPEAGEDILNINGRDFVLTYLTPYFKGNKGGNSFVFRATPVDGGEQCVIKFCRYHSGRNDGDCPRRRARFKREMDALILAREKGFGDAVITIKARGKYRTDSNFAMDFYVMEKAEYDLREFLYKHPVSIQQKLALFRQTLEALRGLHGLGIYHRDIKPDNVLFANGRWKIGDLGLIAHRSADDFADKPREKIGPYGFSSPEAINKALKIIKTGALGDDCHIDDKSDIFQLGQLLWYVLADEVPVGQVESDDLAADVREHFFATLLRMLSFRKTRRPALAELEAGLQPAFAALVV